MHNDPDDEILLRYVSGDATPEDVEHITEWIAGGPERQAWIDRLRSAWNPPAPDAFDPADVLRNQLRSQIIQEKKPRKQIPRAFTFLEHGVGARAVQTVGLVAAVVLAVGAVAYLGRAKPAPPAPPPAAEPPPREFETRRGQRATIALGDGSRVMLDAQSRLLVPAQTNGSAGREVILSGRAFFRVVHDSTRPFRVRTATGLIEDVGTDFLVTAFPEGQQTEVVVSTGVVTVRPTGGSPDSAVRLVPGSMARVDGTRIARVVHGLDPARYLAWTAGRLEFVKTRLGDIIAELQRAYDVDITVADDRLLSRRVTASFGDEGVDRVLEVLATVLHVEVERRGGSITLRSKESSSAVP